jgi:hypothetical protein
VSNHQDIGVIIGLKWVFFPVESYWAAYDQVFYRGFGYVVSGG